MIITHTHTRHRKTYVHIHNLNTHTHSPSLVHTHHRKTFIHIHNLNTDTHSPSLVHTHTHTRTYIHSHTLTRTQNTNANSLYNTHMLYDAQRAGAMAVASLGRLEANKVRLGGSGKHVIIFLLILMLFINSFNCYYHCLFFSYCLYTSVRYNVQWYITLYNISLQHTS